MKEGRRLLLPLLCGWVAEGWSRLCRWSDGWVTGLGREPHFLVGDPEAPYLRRWYNIPRNPLLNCYLHRFVRDDDDRALHDHPWRSASLCLSGSYVEHLHGGAMRTVRAWSLTFRRAAHAHRVVLPDARRGAWTLFVTGPVVREWGFACPAGWRHWRDFTAPGRPGQIGRGCD